MPNAQNTDVISKNVRLELLPPSEAVSYFSSKGMKLTTDWRDLWQEEHARTFTVAKLARLDLLQAVHDGVDDAIRNGTSLREFQKQLTPILQKAGWWGKKERVVKSTGEVTTVNMGSPQRLALIYDVNLRTAYAAGRWQRIQSNKNVLGTLVYRTMKDSRVRPLHRSWEGVALPVDHSFWDTHYPPNGWKCRCLVYAVDDDGLTNLKAQGPIRQTAPHIELMQWLNRKTGEIQKVPFGIDPGWAYNPGKAGARLNSLQQTVMSKLSSVTNSLGIAAVDDFVLSSEFADFYAEPKGRFPIAMLDSQLREQLGAGTNIIQLSAETLISHKQKHPEIDLTHYRMLPDIVKHGMVITQGDTKLVFIRKGDAIFKAVVKATKDGKELFLTTLYKVRPAEIEREIRRDLKRGELIRNWE